MRGLGPRRRAESISFVCGGRRGSSVRGVVPGPMADLEVGIHHVLNNLLTRTIDDGEPR